MLLLLLLVVVFLARLGQSAAAVGTLVDLQYDVPECQVRNRTLTNAFGGITLSYDLMGRALQLQLWMDPRQQSCRLCAIAEQYCNASEPALSPDTSYNLRVVSLRSNGAVYASQFAIQGLQYETDAVLPWQGDTEAAQLDGLCGHFFRLHLSFILHLQQPLERDVPAVAQFARGDWVGCGGAELSCRLAPRYPTINVSVDNCLRTHSSAPTEYDSHSPLFWRLNAPLWPTNPLRLCGESLQELFERLRPEDWLCDPVNALYVKPLPWYELAMEMGVAWLDGCLGQQPTQTTQGGDANDNNTRFTIHASYACTWMDTAVIRALDVLERTCSQRQPDVALEETVLYNLTVELRDRRPVHHDAECARLQPSQNVTLPYYARHLQDWQLWSFQYLVYFDADQPWRAGLLVAMWTIAGLSAVTAVVGIAVVENTRCMHYWQPYQLIE